MAEETKKKLSAEPFVKVREEALATKRGKPLAQVTSYRPSDRHPKPGKLADTLVFEKDIVSPLGEEIWDVCG